MQYKTKAKRETGATKEILMAKRDFKQKTWSIGSKS